MRDALADFDEALYGINDEHLLASFRNPLDVGRRLIDLHGGRATATIADDAANLRSLFMRYAIPREDAEFGPLNSLKRLRSARGTLIAEIEAVLLAAESVGLEPQNPSFRPPPSIEFERAGLSGLLAGMERRLVRVEASLDDLRPEGDATPEHSSQQVQLVNFFVDNVAAEIALARAETSAPIVDFASLTRAVEVMAELTRNFLVTVRAWRARVTRSLQRAAGAFRPLVKRVVRELKVIIHRVRRIGEPAGGSARLAEPGASAAGPGPEGPDTARQPTRSEPENDVDGGSPMARDRLLRTLQSTFGCSAEVAEEILREGSIRLYGAGDRIVTRGDRISHVFVVVSGHVESIVYSVDGQAVQLGRYGPGDFFGAATTTTATHEADVIARDEVAAFLLDSVRLQQLAEQHGAIGLGLLKSMVERLQQTADRMYEHAALSAAGRVHAELLRQARESEDLTIRPRPLLAELALRVSTSRETASRALNALERRGIIRKDDQSISILAPERLEQLIF